MCYICEERAEVGARYRKIQPMCRSVGKDLDQEGFIPFGAFTQPDRTKRPPSLATERRRRFKQGPIGPAQRCPATLPLWPEAI